MQIRPRLHRNASIYMINFNTPSGASVSSTTFQTYSGVSPHRADARPGAIASALCGWPLLWAWLGDGDPEEMQRPVFTRRRPRSSMSCSFGVWERSIKSAGNPPSAR